jgi:hypothetical protein
LRYLRLSRYEVDVLNFGDVQGDSMFLRKAGIYLRVCSCQNPKHHHQYQSASEQKEPKEWNSEEIKSEGNGKDAREELETENRKKQKEKRKERKRKPERRKYE